MVNRPFVVLGLLISALTAQAKLRVIEHPSKPPTPQSVMWIAAQPDDEVVVAPLLSQWCRDGGVRCTLLVLTRGDRGVCLSLDGCLPDVPTVRSAEEAAASQYFNADLILLTLPDGGGSSPPSWQFAPENTTLISKIVGYIEIVHPDLILTFDPRHGTTCHPDHRAVATAVINAVGQVSYGVSLYLLETRVVVPSDAFALLFSSASPAAVKYDANEFLASTPCYIVGLGHRHHGTA